MIFRHPQSHNHHHLIVFVIFAVFGALMGGIFLLSNVVVVNNKSHSPHLPLSLNTNPTIVAQQQQQQRRLAKSDDDNSRRSSLENFPQLKQRQQLQQQQRRHPRLYTCSSSSGTSTMFSHWHRVFPEYDIMDGLPWDTNNNNNDNDNNKIVAHHDDDFNHNKNDLLIIPMYQRCGGGSGGPLSPHDILQHQDVFHGKILWFRAEPKFWTLDTQFSHQRVSNQFQMGTFSIDKYSSRSHSSTSTSNGSTTEEQSLYLRGGNDNNINASRGNTIQTTTTTTMTPYQDFWKRHTLQVHYLTLVVLEQVYDSSERWNWLVNPSFRRQNTRQHGNAVIYMARNCVDFRQKTATTLSHTLHLPIHYASGGCSVDGEDNVAIQNHPRSTYTTNYELMNEYKYCLVMENTAMDGYITEKIVNAFLGGCIPIYYGTHQIFDIFNNEAFVFWDIDHPSSAIDTIQYLEHNDTAYMEMLQQPILKNGSDTIDQYFSLYPTMENGSLNQRVRDLLRLPKQSSSINVQ